MNEADRLLLQAALDGEMDSPTFAAFECRLMAEPDLAAAYAHLRALRRELRAMPAHRAPQALRVKISTMVSPPAAGAAAKAAAPWRALAACLTMLGIGLVAGWNAAPHGPDLESEVLAGHLRGMMSSRPVDVISTDQHTVKPWFAGRLSVAPFVPDLSAQGYALEGGRIDVIEGQAAATLVYRVGKHAVSVTRLPDNVGLAPLLAKDRTINGYVVVYWSQNGVNYAATSDASRDELTEFTKSFKASAGGRT